MGDLSINFSRHEFKCHCGRCDCDTVDRNLIEVLQWLRNQFGEEITINSGHRCEEHNRAIGGTENSQHLQGRAADIVVKNKTPLEVYELLAGTLGQKISLGLYETFVHVDTRTKGGARWRG
jgi:uncharacterized protein YcbK (DUF882 family)